MTTTTTTFVDDDDVDNEDDVGKVVKSFCFVNRFH